MSQMLRLVLLGNSAVGKSSCGNTILGRRVFEARSSLKAVTTHVSEATEHVRGRSLSVVDTPGILNPRAQDTIRVHCEEILGSPQPCVFLVVLNVGRVTSEQVKALKACMEVLGEEGMRRSLLLFTFGEALNGRSLEDFIFEDDKGPLPDIFTKKFGGRHHMFDNEAWSQEQVMELLQKSDQLHLNTSGRSFTADAEVRSRVQTGAESLQSLSLTEDTCTSQISLQRPDTSSSTPQISTRRLKLVLLGLPGAGKSTSGNTILGNKEFKTSCGFDSVSTEAVSETAHMSGRMVTVVDTPGFSDEELKPKKLFKTIMKSVIKNAPNPHAFIIVVRLGRVSTRDFRLLQLIPKLFDKEAAQFTMVLFTHGDELKKHKEKIKDLIQRNDKMKSLVEKCNKNYHVFNNELDKSDTRYERQVEQLFKMVEDMVRNSGMKHCSSQIFRLTTDEKIKVALEELWKHVKNLFCCCSRPNTDSDEEGQPLLNLEDLHLKKEEEEKEADPPPQHVTG